MKDFFPREGYRTCFVCGKRFYVSDLSAWVFRRRPKNSGKDYSNKWFCSWHCLCQFDRELETKKAKKRGDNDK